MKRQKKLRTGFTTGTCAAAAAKGALLSLLGKSTATVQLELPEGRLILIRPRRTERKGEAGICEVIKDGGDDPDVTNGACIRAAVRIRAGREIIIKAGHGVGTVTRPGLAVQPGEPAINPVPRQMIRDAVAALLPAHKALDVCISVDRGEELARKTLNPRLGIVGGISILGTTGIVVPYSHEAYKQSISCALDVARAMNLAMVVFSTGRGSEKLSRSLLPHIPEASFILMADYFSFALSEAAARGITNVVITCFPGKLLKMASGAACTHCGTSSVDLAFLAGIAAKEGCGEMLSRDMAHANTVRHGFSLMSGDCAGKTARHLARLVADRVHKETGGTAAVRLLVFSYRNEVLHSDVP